MDATLQQSTSAYLSVYPAADGGGKWHAALMVSDVSYCGSSQSRVVLDTSASPIIVERGERPHPFVCKRCVAYWAAHGA